MGVVWKCVQFPTPDARHPKGKPNRQEMQKNKHHEGRFQVPDCLFVIRDCVLEAGSAEQPDMESRSFQIPPVKNRSQGLARENPYLSCNQVLLSEYQDDGANNTPAGLSSM